MYSTPHSRYSTKSTHERSISLAAWCICDYFLSCSFYISAPKIKCTKIKWHSQKIKFGVYQLLTTWKSHSLFRNKVDLWNHIPGSLEAAPCPRPHFLWVRVRRKHLLLPTHSNFSNHVSTLIFCHALFLWVSHHLVTPLCIFQFWHSFVPPKVLDLGSWHLHPKYFYFLGWYHD